MSVASMTGSVAPGVGGRPQSGPGSTALVPGFGLKLRMVWLWCRCCGLLFATCICDPEGWLRSPCLTTAFTMVGCTCVTLAAVRKMLLACLRASSGGEELMPCLHCAMQLRCKALTLPQMALTVAPAELEVVRRPSFQDSEAEEKEVDVARLPSAGPRDGAAGSTASPPPSVAADDTPPVVAPEEAEQKSASAAELGAPETEAEAPKSLTAAERCARWKQRKAERQERMSKKKEEKDKLFKSTLSRLKFSTSPTSVQHSRFTSWGGASDGLLEKRNSDRARACVLETGTFQLSDAFSHRQDGSWQLDECNSQASYRAWS